MTPATVLVLNADYSPLEIVSWQRAMNMLLREKVRLVEAYAGRALRSPSTTFAFPAVVARIRYVDPRRNLRLSRKNLIARDHYTCQYCGARPRNKGGTPRLTALTLDHVIPRAQSRDGWVSVPWKPKPVRVTSWHNLVCACAPCNAHKADRTPEQAGMVLRKAPGPPTAQDLVWMSLFRYQIPTEWEAYLPEDSPWRDYWTVELTD